ncbi:MAG: hypothetical protein JRN15_08565 [Nitrososphaerota archaeon]|nr:hypothetical protein [Nitrososphaerota archaeon]
MNLADQFYLVTLLSLAWAATTVKPLRKGWRNLGSDDKQIVFVKISLAVALVAANIVIFIKK